MGSKKKSAKKIELEEDATNSSITAISDDDEEANKDLSLEIIQKALHNRSTNLQNGAALDAPRVIADSKVDSDDIKLKRKKKKKRKKLESEFEAAVIVEEEEKENVETIEVAEKVEHAKAETSVVDTSDDAVLRNTGFKSHSVEIKTQKKKKKKKKLESEIEAVKAVVVEEEKENVEIIDEVVEKVQHTEVETSVVDMSDDVVLRNAGSESHSEEIKTQKKKKKKKHESDVQTVNAVIVEEEEKEAVETIEDPEKVEPGKAETGVVNTSDNVVLRKLLRGPRYFDPPSDSVSIWGTCFNCGEEGHASFNCTAARRKKPCFICGSLSHNVKKCTMARYCSTCKIVGHRSKDCPKKHGGDSNSKSLTVCLRCGNFGHDMFFCKNDYSQDDLKEIQCYVCMKFGHLCCVNTTEAMPKEFSCYRCGQMGHIGWACSRLQNEATDAATPSSCYNCGEKGHFARECSSSVKASSRWQPETNDTATPSSCYRCGEKGHFSRECPSSAKACSRWQPETNDPATPSLCYRCGEEGHFSRECPNSATVGNRKHKLWETPRSQKENGYMGYESAPHEYGNSSKKTRLYTEESDIKTPKKSKHRGGWMTEHPGEFSPSNSKRDSWRSPVTPCTYNSTNNHRYFNNGTGSHTFGSKSYKMGNFHDGTPNSEGSGRTFHHGYSASRFTNTSSNGFQRNYNGW
ncbi:uncharacterized protein LOC123923557 isoform X2 [Trifolium pratense]|uniref:uncharacterized protein LOC123923557 isoform X2 n=1 Tax=Trifolium pratense TaxID=57577 RepID=UPI001E69456C|nr:uncharacterized protein LOC123923557 isoform X2 [Trifolium pratense]